MDRRDQGVVTLREWRQECHVTQVQLGALMGTTQAFASSQERAPLRTTSVAALYRRATALRSDVLLCVVRDGAVTALADPWPGDLWRAVSLRQLRAASGLTQGEVADAGSLVTSGVSRAETVPLARMRVGTVARFVQGLGLQLYVCVVLPDGRTAVVEDRGDGEADQRGLRVVDVDQSEVEAAGAE
jgi:hypothetical protein